MLTWRTDSKRSRVILLALLLLACMPGTKAAVDEGEACGVERWAVKTLSDGDASRVNLTPVPGDIVNLRALAAPADLPQTSRIPPAELTTFTITVRLVEFKLEDDRDIHLVVSTLDNPSSTMIVEFPDTEACSGADISTERQDMADARAALIAAEGKPPSSKFKKLTGTAVITGIGFFDFKHGQRGVAPNAIELHPVLKFELIAPVIGSTASVTPVP